MTILPDLHIVIYGIRYDIFFIIAETARPDLFSEILNMLNNWYISWLDFVFPEHSSLLSIPVNHFHTGNTGIPSRLSS
jgi:hypothetical protein